MNYGRESGDILIGNYMYGAIVSSGKAQIHKSIVPR